jgi:hypothetical protein
MELVKQATRAFSDKAALTDHEQAEKMTVKGAGKTKLKVNLPKKKEQCTL